MRLLDLSARRALVTGASQGIGLALARDVGRLGLAVVEVSGGLGLVVAVTDYEGGGGWV